MPNKALIEAAETGDVKALKEILDSGVPVDEPNESDTTALWITSQKGHFEATQYLLEKGADVNKPNKMGISPLFIASSRGFDKVITLLLQYNAVLEVDNPSKRTPMFAAVAAGHLSGVKALLKAPEAKLDERGIEGQTLLLTAAAANKVDVFEWLLNQGASIEEKNNAGETALDIAIKYKRQGIVNFLQNYSIKTKLSIIWKNLAPYQKTKDFTKLSYDFLYRKIFSKISFNPNKFLSYKASTIPISSSPIVSIKNSDTTIDENQAQVPTSSQKNEIKINHESNSINSTALATSEIAEQAQILSQREFALSELEAKILKRMQNIEQKVNQLKQESIKPNPLEKTMKEQRKRITTLENNFSRQSSISSGLNNELSELKIEMEDFQKKIYQETHLKEQLNLHMQKVDSLEENLLEQTQQTSELNNYIKKLQLQTAELERQFQGYNGLKEDLRVQKNKSKQDFHRSTQLEQSLKESLENINLIQSKFSELSQHYHSLDKRIESCESQAKLIELQSQQITQLKTEIELQKNQFKQGLHRISQLEILLREQAPKIHSQSSKNAKQAQQANTMQIQIRRLEQQLEFIQKTTSSNHDLKEEIEPIMQRIIQLENNLPGNNPQSQMYPSINTLDPQMMQLQLQQQQMNLLYNPYISLLQGVPSMDLSLLKQNEMSNVPNQTMNPSGDAQVNYLTQPMTQQIAILSSGVNVALPDQMSKVLLSFAPSYHILIVGGAVRDLLLGKIPADVDVITNMPPETLLSRFKECSIHASPHFSGYYQMIQFGMKIDIISCESDVFLSMDAFVRNALTRAFTVNALYCDIQGRIYDPLQAGLADLLQNPMLRFIGDSHSWFERDPILLLRAVRLTTQYALNVPEEMQQSIQYHSTLLKVLDSQRLHVEIKRLFLRGMSVKNFGYLIEWNLLATLYPKTAGFLKSEKSGFYFKWLQEKLQQTDNLIFDQKPASINYIYALLLTGGILSIPEIAKYNMNQVIEQEVNDTLFNLDNDSVNKIKKTIYHCVRELLPTMNTIHSTEKVPIVSNVSDAQPIVVQFKTQYPEKKNSMKRVNSDPGLSCRISNQ